MYNLLPENEQDEKLLHNGLSDTELDERLLYKQPTPVRRYKVVFWLYGVALHITVVVLLALYLQESADFLLWTHELPSARDFIRYETVQFSPSGFTFTKEPANPYAGIPDNVTDALWLNLTQVGMYGLSEKEYITLHNDKARNLTTQPNWDYEAEEPTNEYLITLEVFHQLHCLNYIRRRVYEEPGERFQVESDRSRSMHLVHCIDYLRQVLMCHADLTPITFNPNPGSTPPHFPNFSIVHTCRNWDLVYEFAKRGNTTGEMIE